MHRLAPLTARRMLLLTSLAAMSACGLYKSVLEAPANVARAVLPSSPGEVLEPIETLHPRLLALADTCDHGVRQATESFSEEAKSTFARNPAKVRAAYVQSLRWRLSLSRQFYQAATCPSSLTGLLNVLVVVRTNQVLFQTYGIAEQWGYPSNILVEEIDKLEAACWVVVVDYIGKTQVDEIRKTLDTWQAKMLSEDADEADELPDFRQIAHSLGKNANNGSGSILSFLSIDPLAGLEPVAREVALTRQFTEKMLFWAERVPALIDIQAELAKLEVQALPEVATSVASLERATKAADSIAQTASALPQRIETERQQAVKQVADALAAEREAAIRQISAEIDAQRRALFADLEKASAPLQTMVVASRDAIAAGTALSQELTKTAVAVDNMLKHFDRDPNAPKPAEPDPAQPSKPFDIVEYGDTATRVAEAAKELRGAVTAVDTVVPQLRETIDDAIDNAFWKGTAGACALIFCSAISVLLVRALSSRIGRRNPG